MCEICHCGGGAKPPYNQAIVLEIHKSYGFSFG